MTGYYEKGIHAMKVHLNSLYPRLSIKDGACLYSNILQLIQYLLFNLFQYSNRLRQFLNTKRCAEYQKKKTNALAEKTKVQI